MVPQAYEMVRLAKKVANEAEFQQKQQYKIFKAKQNVHQRQLYNLANELFSLNFHEECIYWCHKVFEELRISDKKERHSVLTTISLSYYNLKNYEKTLEYGQKSLDLELKKPLTQTMNTLVAMEVSASKIKRYQDASKYAKETLKMNILRCNEKKTPRTSLLISYSNLIDLQIKDGNIKGAKKTIKHLTILNLNSIDPNDVLVSMEKEGYEKLLPLSDLLRNNNHIDGSLNDTTDKDHIQYVTKFCDKNFSNIENLKEFIYHLQTYHSIGKICWLKFMIYRHFDSMQNCEKWGLLHRNVLFNILVHMNILVNKQKANEDFEALQKNGIGVLTYEHYILEFINCSLRLANDDPDDDRQRIFEQLCKHLLTSNRSSTNFILAAIRKYPIDVTHEVMPFLQYFIKLCFKLEEYHKNASEAANAAEYQAYYQERKTQMITFKNSLTIMNHFKTFSIRDSDEL